MTIVRGRFVFGQILLINLGPFTKSIVDAGLQKMAVFYGFLALGAVDFNNIFGIFFVLALNLNTFISLREQLLLKAGSEQ